MASECSTTTTSFYNNANKSQTELNFYDEFLLIWLDADTDIVNNDNLNTILHLKTLITCIQTFSNIDECLNCVKENEKKLIYFIVSGRLGEKIISYIHPMVQTQSVYVFCSNILRHTQWATQHSKIRGVFNDIKPLCEQLKRELLWFIPLEQNLYSITTTVQYPENSFTPDENDDPAEFFKHYCIDIPFSRRQSFSIQDQNNNQEFCKQSNSHDEESNDPSKFDEGILRKCDEFDCCQKQIDDLPSSSIPTSLIITDDVNCQTHEESSIIVDHKESNLVTASTLISSAHSNNLSKIVDKSLECIKEKGVNDFITILKFFIC
ncbi:unnamed protein product [Didymodactylos carnosus]|uniref:Uncharacterized protein n=1 Tax=Didymodactylos carnosus TaxID=1234261 RepID=A0A814ULE4_9BILA|nr:unnamed protein product [Didymodactylos carnosus]CAF3941292.1 unnamed protein product [Didymodactylos carnosus]